MKPTKEFKLENRRCQHCNSVLFWEGHPFAAIWICRNRCVNPVKDKPKQCCEQAVAAERERILKALDETVTDCYEYCNHIKVHYDLIEEILSRHEGESGNPQISDTPDQPKQGEKK